MKHVFFFFTIIAFLCCAVSLQAKDAAAYIDEARKLNEEGKLPEAIALLQQAVGEYPDNADLHAYLGLYTGMSAGRTSDYMEAMRLVTESFTMLDKAVELAPKSHRGYLFRGIMGVQIPKMLGRLDGGIADLEHVAEMGAEARGAIDMETLVTVYTNLATGYEKNGDIEKARTALLRIVYIVPGTDAAKKAEERIAALPQVGEAGPDPLAPREGDAADAIAIKEKIAQAPGDKAPILELGRLYYGKGRYAETAAVLKRYVALDQTSAEAYKLLGLSVAMVASSGYDDNVYANTDYMSSLAFESIGYMDRAASLAPDDPEIRFIRGIFGIMFPFFVGKHDQGVEDLEFVSKSGAPDSMKSQALYYLGLAKQQEATRYWIEVVKEYPEEQAARLAFGQMRPPVQHFDPSKHEKPLVAIDFILGFQDELAPQTAVWIEDADGAYVTTVYISGFSGHAKEKQVNLPVWAAMSKFEGVEGVTSASIDVGHHILTWDLKGRDGKKVKSGKYTVKVEVSYWPTMKYQLAEASLMVGKKGGHAIVEEGDYIPRLEVTYYAD